MQNKLKNLEETGKSVSKIMAELGNITQSMEGKERAHQTALDGVRFDVARVAREHEADQLRIDRLQRICEAVDLDFSQHKLEQRESFRMHDEEFHQRIVVVDGIQHEMRIQMNRVLTANARLQEQLSDQGNLLNRFEISTEQLDLQVQTQQEKKIDAKLFENKMFH